MKVKELIKILSLLNPDKEVVCYSHGEGITSEIHSVDSEYEKIEIETD